MLAQEAGGAVEVLAGTAGEKGGTATDEPLAGAVGVDPGLGQGRKQGLQPPVGGGGGFYNQPVRVGIAAIALCFPRTAVGECKDEASPVP